MSRIAVIKLTIIWISIVAINIILHQFDIYSSFLPLTLFLNFLTVTLILIPLFWLSQMKNGFPKGLLITVNILVAMLYFFLLLLISGDNILDNLHNPTVLHKHKITWYKSFTYTLNQGACMDIDLPTSFNIETFVFPGFIHRHQLNYTEYQVVNEPHDSITVIVNRDSIILNSDDVRIRY